MSREEKFLEAPLAEAPYRFVTKAPNTLRLSLAELLTNVPKNWIREGYLTAGIVVDLSCAQILQSPIPRISVEQLQKLVPQSLCIPQEVPAKTKIVLPTTRVALAYHFSTEREEHPLISENATSAALPLEESLYVPDPSSLPSAADPIQEPLGEDIRQIIEQATKESASCEAPQEKPENEKPENFSTWKPTPQFFASLPVFLPTPVPAAGVLEGTSFPATSFSSPLEHQPFTSSLSPHSVNVATAQSLENHRVAAPANEALGKQHLITPISQPLEPLSNESELQTLLLTEEPLSIHRVLDLCSQLPGVNNCLLARGWEVVASSQLPEGLNPITLSSQASALLEGIREASKKMGLGTFDAVTLFSAAGPVSFLQDQDLCFLILHKDRGFFPGVKEKMQLILAELNKSQLLIPPTTSKVERIIETQTPSE